MVCGGVQSERKTTHWDYLSPTFLPEKKGNNHFLSIVFSKKFNNYFSISVSSYKKWRGK